MAAVEDILLSQVTLYKQLTDGGIEEAGDFDLSALIEVTFIETVDISGPRLILKMDDFTNYIRDELEARPRDLLKVTFSSHWYEGDGDEFDLVLWFRILKAPQQLNAITFLCIEKEVEAIKQPAAQAQLFCGKTAGAILKKLLPGLKHEVGSFPVLLDYHVLPGMRAAKVIRQMCHEMKAACFHRRKVVVFETWEKLKNQEAEFEYYHQNQAGEESDEEIMRYTLLRAEDVVKDRIERNYTSWSLKDGIVSVTKEKMKKKAAEWVAQPEKAILDNILVAPSPIIDFLVTGQGDLRPGTIMDIVWHNDNPEKPIDESLPKKILLSTVAHYYGGNKYMCRIKGINILAPGGAAAAVSAAVGTAVASAVTATTTAASAVTSAAAAVSAAAAPVAAAVSAVTNAAGVVVGAAASALSTASAFAVSTINGLVTVANDALSAATAAASEATAAASAALAAATAEAARVAALAAEAAATTAQAARLAASGALADVTTFAAGATAAESHINGIMATALSSKNVAASALSSITTAAKKVEAHADTAIKAAQAATLSVQKEVSKIASNAIMTATQATTATASLVAQAQTSVNAVIQQATEVKSSVAKAQALVAEADNAIASITSALGEVQAACVTAEAAVTTAQNAAYSTITAAETSASAAASVAHFK